MNLHLSSLIAPSAGSNIQEDIQLVLEVVIRQMVSKTTHWNEWDDSEGTF